MSKRGGRKARVITFWPSIGKPDCDAAVELFVPLIIDHIGKEAGCCREAQTVADPEFWEVIAAVKGADGDDAHAKRLVTKLRKRSPSAIVAFALNFHRAREPAHRGDVWAAGLLLNHGHAYG